MSASIKPVRQRIAAWLGSALMVCAAGYILLGGHPAIDPSSARDRIASWNKALINREALKLYQPSITYEAIQIIGWGYERQAIISKPKFGWKFYQQDWSLIAKDAVLKPDKVNPKRFMLTISGPLELIKNHAPYASIMSEGQFIYTYNETGEDHLNSINQQLILPEDITLRMANSQGNNWALKSNSGDSFLRLGLMSNIGKITLSASTRSAQLVRENTQVTFDIDEWQLNLLENRASDGSRLGHITLSAKLREISNQIASEFEGAADYVADTRYSKIDVTIPKLYAKHPQGNRSLSGVLQVNEHHAVSGRLEMMPSRIIVTDQPLHTLIDFFQP